MSERTLLLVDGMAVAYRAFYAIPNLSTKAGRPTNALFGFIRMFQQMEQLWKPTHRAVVFDAGVPKARVEKLPSYKAQRTPMPDPLREQFPVIREYLERADVPCISVEGEEADDVMATIVERAGDSIVLMASNDKDLFQLVNERVSIIPPTKLGARMGPKEVCEKTGVMPERFVEWLALTGDTVDNIPGLSGVGPKTAAKLVSQCRSLLGSLDEPNADVPEKLKSLLSANREDLARNIELITLRRDLPLALDWEMMKARSPDPAKLIPFYEEMEFKSMAQALRDEQAGGLLLDFGE